MTTSRDSTGRPGQRAWVPVRCQRSGNQMVALFQRDPSGWVLRQARRAPGGDDSARVELSGAFLIDSGYSGCPDCSAASFVKCGDCQRLSCWDGETRMFTCRACGSGGEISGTIESLSAADTG